MDKTQIEKEMLRANNFLKIARYNKYKESLLGESVINLYSDLGLSEHGQIEIINSRDNKVFLGFLMSQVQLKPKARENIISGLNAITTPEE